MAFEYIEQYTGMGFRVGFVSTPLFPLHYHSEFELLYSLSGSYCITLPDEAVSMNEGDCVIVNRNVVHMFSSPDIENSAILYINISPNFCHAYCPRFSDLEIISPRVSKEDHPRFIKTYRDFIRLYFSEGFHPGAGTRLNLMSLLTKLCGQMMSELPNRIIADAPNTKRNRDRLSDILNYVMQNHARKITLAEVAEHYGLDPFYLSHFIHDNLGVSFQKYLNRVRLDHAVKMINCDPKVNMSQVCEEAGFSAPKYLRAAFMDCFQCSPAEYRDRYIGRYADFTTDDSTLIKENYVCAFPFVPRTSVENKSATVLTMLDRAKGG